MIECHDRHGHGNDPMVDPFSLDIGSSSEDLSWSYSCVSDLSKTFRREYLEGGTIGVLQQQQAMQKMWIATSHAHDSINNPYCERASTMVSAALEASRGNKWMASGMLNAMIGACCGMRQPRAGSKLAAHLMLAYDEVADDFIKPDLVALCLAYTATIDVDPRTAETFLKRAANLYPTKDVPDVSNAAEAPNWGELESRFGISLLQESTEFVVLVKPSGMLCCHVVMQRLILLEIMRISASKNVSLLMAFHCLR